MKRIGLISDTHGHYDKRYAKYFSSCDQIWHAGDVGDITIIDQLNKIAPTKAVYGNIDNLTIRAELPLYLSFNVEQVSVFIIHIGGKPYAYPKKVVSQLKTINPQLYICGHSHICKVQMDKRLKMLYINPGAAGINGFHKIRTLIRFSIDKNQIKDLEVIELGSRSKLS